MSRKEFKTINEQLNILSSRGLIISDYEKAAEFLFHNNYYRVSGYSLTLRDHDVFFETATFDNIIDIYEFDRELRNILFKYLEIIEITVKSIYAHEFTRLYGPTGYRDASFFSDAKKHQDIMDKINAQIQKRHSHEAYLKHFLDELHQDLPLWVCVDLMTISNISVLYSISDSQIKFAVSKEMGVQVGNRDVLGSLMHNITILRNLCAHGSRLFNRLFKTKPSLPSKERSLLILNSDGSRDNSHLYGFVLIMRRLLSLHDFKCMLSEIVKLTEKYPFVRMDYYGFRNDWEEKLSVIESN